MLCCFLYLLLRLELYRQFRQDLVRDLVLYRSTSASPPIGSGDVFNQVVFFFAGEGDDGHSGIQGQGDHDQLIPCFSPDLGRDGKL
jgi:hypothetical protein